MSMTTASDSRMPHAAFALGTRRERKGYFRRLCAAVLCRGVRWSVWSVAACPASRTLYRRPLGTRAPQLAKVFPQLGPYFLSFSVDDGLQLVCDCAAPSDLRGSGSCGVTRGQPPARRAAQSPWSARAAFDMTTRHFVRGCNTLVEAERALVL
jgi:hypothetical protein